LCKTSDSVFEVILASAAPGMAALNCSPRVSGCTGSRAVDRIAVPRLGRQDLASLIDQKAPGVSNSRIDTLHGAHLGDQFGITDFGRQSFAVADCCAKWLFHEHVLAGLQSPNSRVDMELVDNRYDDRLHLGIAEIGVILGKRFPAFKSGGYFLNKSSATSQIAYNSALRALSAASRCAACEIGPQPRTPTRKRRFSFFIPRLLHEDGEDNEAMGLVATIAFAFGKKTFAEQHNLSRGVMAIQDSEPPRSGLCEAILDCWDAVPLHDHLAHSSIT
jgi:hypothetical protein